MIPIPTRQLGSSTLRVPIVSFGAGPISGLMVGDDVTAQIETVERAIQLGVNYFDTAATYGDGRSEASLGRALKTLQAVDQVMIASKVRVPAEARHDIRGFVRQSFEATCERLGAERISLLQLHNSITEKREDLPTSLNVQDVLGRHGVAEAFEDLKHQGRVEQLGFTGLGDSKSLTRVISDGPFVAAQIPLNLLTPIAGEDRFAGSVDVDYRQLAGQCQDSGVGVIAIRVFAGGALAGQPPSAHTHKTKFFALDLFQRDQQRAAELQSRLQRISDGPMSCPEASLRYVAYNLGATTALIGFASVNQVDSAAAMVSRGPIDEASVFEAPNSDH